MTIISDHNDVQEQAKSECIKKQGQKLSYPIYMRKKAKPQKPEVSKGNFSHN